jgi:hypothetical protein
VHLLHKTIHPKQHRFQSFALEDFTSFQIIHLLQRKFTFANNITSWFFSPNQFVLTTMRSPLPQCSISVGTQLVLSFGNPCLLLPPLFKVQDKP